VKAAVQFTSTGSSMTVAISALNR